MLTSIEYQAVVDVVPVAGAKVILQYIGATWLRL
jgi:hypothetical protein